jgi:hypothetical protein
VTISARNARKIRRSFKRARAFYNYWAIMDGAFISPEADKFFIYAMDTATRLYWGIDRYAFIRHMDTLLTNHEESK